MQIKLCTNRFPTEHAPRPGLRKADLMHKKLGGYTYGNEMV